MPDLFRMKGGFYEKELYIFSKDTISVQISETAAVHSVFQICRKILVFYRKPGFYHFLCGYPFPPFSGKPDLFVFQ